MDKRVFQIFDEMNVNDEQNKTTTAGICNAFVGGQKTKTGGHITMGVPADIFMDVINNLKTPLLLIVDMKEYNRIKANPATEEVDLTQLLLDFVAFRSLSHEEPRGEKIHRFLTEKGLLK